jgi:hypothetical protein
MRRSWASRRSLTSKYGAIRTEVDGIVFASHAEARRYIELKLLEKAGEITNLVLQPKFPIVVNGFKICTFIGDFSYIKKLVEGQNGDLSVVEDVKGVATPTFRLKMKLVKALYNIDILVTK